MSQNQIRDLIKRYSPFVVAFILFFVLLRLSTMMYDGWNGSTYYKKHGGIIPWIQYVFGKYREITNGRVGANIIGGVLESFKSEILLDTCASLMFVGILVCVGLLIEKRRTLSITWSTMLIYTVAIFLLPYTVRTYVVQIASIVYCMPILLMLICILLFDAYEKQHKKSHVVCIYILSFFASSWMENQSVAFGCVLVLLCMRNAKKNKCFDIWLWLSVVVALIAGLIMVTAPGMHANRIDVQVAEPFIQLSRARLHQHIIYLFILFIYNNAMGNILMFGVMGMFSFWKIVKEKQHKIVHLVMLILDILILGGFFYVGGRSRQFIYTAEIDNSLLYYLFSLWNGWFIVVATAVYFLWFVFYAIVLSKRSRFIKYMLLFGVISIAILLPTNQIGDRIYSPVLFVNIIIIATMVAVITKERCVEGWQTRVVSVILALTIVTGLDYYVQLCNRLCYVRQDQETRIEQLRKAQFLGTVDLDECYELPSYNQRDAYLGGVINVGDYHYKWFLNYYELDSRTKVCFKQ